MLKTLPLSYLRQSIAPLRGDDMGKGSVQERMGGKRGGGGERSQKIKRRENQKRAATTEGLPRAGAACPFEMTTVSLFSTLKQRMKKKLVSEQQGGPQLWQRMKKKLVSEQQGARSCGKE